MRPASIRISRIAPLLTLLAFLAGASAAAAPDRAGEPLSQPPTIAIQPLGYMEPKLVHAVAERIEASFAVSVVVLPVQPLPQSAFYPPRNRFRGERVLDWLNANKPAQVSRILGLTSCDLSVTKGPIYDWGVMGVAGLSRPAGVVSVHRLRGHHVSPSQVARRASQVAVHELSHTFGLSHCRTPRCIMNEAQGGIGPVDASSGIFCSQCRLQLRESPAITWRSA